MKKIYYMVDGKSFHDNYDEDDDSFYNCANYFNDKKLAENISRMQTLQRKMFRWQAENDKPVDLKTSCVLWTIINNEVTSFYRSNSSCKHVYGFLPYFSSREKAEECIEVFKDDLTWLFTEFQWRMDDKA